MNLADEEWKVLIDKLEGYSGSDIRSVVNGALYEPVRSMQSAYHWKQNAGINFAHQKLQYSVLCADCVILGMMKCGLKNC